MGTIVARQRADGTKTYTAQILRKKAGVILHREAETFLLKTDAERWMRNRESALDKPEGLELARSPNPPFAAVIDRFLAENNRQYGATQLNLYTNLKDSPLAGMLCADIRSADIVAWGKQLLEQGRSRSTVAGYISALGSIMKLAKPAWGYRVDATVYAEACVAMSRLEIVGKSVSRDRRPTLEELDRLMTYFQDRSIRMHNHGVAPMHRIMAFAIFSCRRLDEIIRQKRSDTDLDGKRMLVREMKDPRNKLTNDVYCDMPDEAVAIARAIKQDPEQPDQLFPWNYGAVQQAFSKACSDLGIKDLRFHDLRHEGISRLFELGKTIPQTACVSGHKNWKSLSRYTHIRQAGDKYAGWKWLPIVTAPQLFQIQP